MIETTLDVGRQPLDVDDLALALSAIEAGEPVEFRAGRKVLAVTVSPEDYRRLQLLKSHELDAAGASRRGEEWEPWEEDLLLSDALPNEELAIRTQRTAKSVSERRRWLRRIAAEREAAAR